MWEPEICRKAPLSCNAAFPMLHCSLSLAAAQLSVKMTSALQKSECCSATSAVQFSENCSATSVFACGMLQGVGFRGVGFSRKRAEYGFGEYGFKHPNSVSFLGLTEFGGASSVSSFQPIICVQTRTHPIGAASKSTLETVFRYRSPFIGKFWTGSVQTGSE